MAQPTNSHAEENLDLSESPTKGPGRVIDFRKPIEISDGFLFLLFAAILLAATIPYIITTRELWHARIARSDARSMTMELESVMRELGDWNAQPVHISWDPESKMLSVPNPGGEPEVITRKLYLTRGTTLYTPEIGNTNTNVVTNTHRYCIAVQHGGAVAYQSQNGPAPNCNQ